METNDNTTNEKLPVVFIGFYTDDDTKRRLKRQAKRDGRSLSKHVDRIVKSYITDGAPEAVS